MKRQKFSLLLACVALFAATFSSCKKEQPKESEAVEQTVAAKESAVKMLTADEFKTLVADYQNAPEKYIGKKPCVVDFYADWCGPCKQMSPIMDALAEENAGAIDFYKVNIDNAQELARAYGIESIPTFFLCSVADGKITTAMGSMPKEEMAALVAKLK